MSTPPTLLTGYGTLYLHKQELDSDSRVAMPSARVKRQLQLLPLIGPCSTPMVAFDWPASCDFLLVLYCD